jgi:hypothetical protein
MKAIYTDLWAEARASCDEPELPNDVIEYFGVMGEPDEAGTEVRLDDALRKWEGFMKEGWEIDIDKVPSDVKIIRFIDPWD